ncbi:MAG: gfo/Idh/MocA family oxidoreductase, partial [Tidjanibacter sp.]|nr:gfo/Idh/MocA family oxidoreductase [Tidjanibacter sp.]
MLAAAALLALGASAQEVIKIGIIGLDTSHSTAFTKLINSGSEEWAEGFKVVAAYPYGSQTI